MNIALIPIDLGSNGGTVAVIPSRALSWHQIQLPAGTLSSGWMQERSSPRLRAILEGLLEDQLLEDPAKMHFALQPNATDTAPIWVAACDKEWLRGALRTLRRNKHKPSKLAPEWAPVALTKDGKTSPSLPSKIWVTGNNDLAHVTWTDISGIHTLPLSANHLTHAQLPAIVFPDAELMAEPAASHLAEQLFHRTARVIPPENRLHRAAQTDWNLGQFEFAWRNPFFIRIAKRWGIFWAASEWRPARIALLIVLLVHILGINAFAWRSLKQLDQQRLAIRDLLVSTFPHVSVVVDPPLQMDRELNLLRQASGGLSPRDLESLLGALGSAGESVLTEGAPTSIDFNPGELRVNGLKSGSPLDTMLNSGLQPLGYVSRIDGNALVISVKGTR
jgi:general secretion pathway protein L